MKTSRFQLTSDGTAGSIARSVAVVVPHAAGAAKAVDGMRSSGAFGAGAPNIDILCLEGADFADASFLHHQSKGTFDEVVVAPSIKLFDSNWSRAFLRLLSNLVTEDGRILLRSKYPLRRRLFGDFVTRRGVENTIQVKQVGAREEFRIYQKQPGPGITLSAPSVLDWYGKNADTLVTLDTEFRVGARGLPLGLDSATCREFVIQNDLGAQPVGRLGNHEIGPGAYMDARKVAIGSHAYLVVGLSSKASVINRIVSDQFGRVQGLSYLDVGGGFGGLAAELLLMDGGRYRKVVTRDYSSLHLALATELYSGMHEHLRGKFFFSPGEAVTFRYTEQLDIISFVGVLLYLRTHLDHVIRSAWNAIAPGGLLVVHENIKAAPNSVDYDKMFTAAELDGLLGECGPIAYYHPDSRLRLPKRLVGNRTVFRVVRKRS